MKPEYKTAEINGRNCVMAHIDADSPARGTELWLRIERAFAAAGDSGAIFSLKKWDAEQRVKTRQIAERLRSEGDAKLARGCTVRCTDIYHARDCQYLVTVE